MSEAKLVAYSPIFASQQGLLTPTAVLDLGWVLLNLVIAFCVALLMLSLRVLLLARAVALC